MFTYILFSVFISQLFITGLVIGIVMLYNKYNEKDRDYDQEYLYNSASSVLLEIFLQNRFPNSVSDKTIPLPDGTSIPAPLNYNQHCIPLDAHELNMRYDAIKKFLVNKYGNIRNFHTEVVNSFESDDSEYSQDSQEGINVETCNQSPSNSDDSESDNEESEKVPVKSVKKEVQDSPKGDSPKPDSPKLDPKPNEVKAKEPRIVKPKPISDDDSDRIIVEKEAPGEKSGSDSSEKGAKFVNDIDVDDEFIARLMAENGVKKTTKKNKSVKK